MRIFHMLLAAAIVVTPAVAASDPTPPFVEEKNTAGELLLSYPLEQRFGVLAGQCSGRAPPLRMARRNLFDAVFTNAPPVSSIDQEIIGRLSLVSPSAPTIRQINPVSIGVIFGYVYPVAELARPVFAPGLLLPIAAVDADKLIPPGFPSLRFEASCSSIIEGALRVNSNLSFPVATIRAALSADHRQETRTLFRLARGRFTSPIWSMWRAQNPEIETRDRQQLYAAMLLWDWYRTPRAGSHKLLAWFDGTYLHSERVRSGDSSAAASVQAGLSIPFLNVDGSISSDLRQSSDLRIYNPEVFVDTNHDGAAAMDFQDMPPPTEIAQAVAGLRSVARITSGGEATVQIGEPTYFVAEVVGLPAAYCSPVWELRDQPGAAAASAQITYAEPPVVVIDQNTSKCRFRFRYLPTTAGSRSFTPHLVSAVASGGNQRLWLRLGELNYTAAEGPELQFVTSVGPELATVVGAEPARTRLSWTVRFRLNDDGRFRDLSRINASRVRLDCGTGVINGGDILFTPAFEGTSNATSANLELRGSADFNGVLQAGGFDRVQCRMSGTLRFTGSGTAAPRFDVAMPSTINLDYPRPKPTP